MSMIGRVIGTAGHVDHGKTTLVRALTGIDTDRLPEEKARGITIELGFAHLTLPTGEVVGVVDVPGHERFVRTMVAGAVGIDLVVLVIAGDEGVMPQTREHLDICALLGVSRAVVALTKCDAVDDEMRALAVAEVAAALRGTFAERAPIVPCSGKTGAGLDALREAIATGLAGVEPRDPDGVVRLPLDRVFTLRGFGTVVTGTLWSGTLGVGDEVEALPPLPNSAPMVAKVRGLQVHGVGVQSARAGQRTAVNLSVAHQLLARGQVLARPGELVAGRIVDVRVRYLPSSRAPLKRRSRALFLAGCAQTEATLTLLDAASVEPGAEALAQLHLDHPQPLLPGDRFVLRGFAVQQNYGATIGGGRILRVLAARARHGTAEIVAGLRVLETADTTARVQLEIARAGTRGLARAALQQRLGDPPRAVEAALDKLQTARAIVRFDPELPAFVDGAALDRLAEQTLVAVRAFFSAQPTATRMGKEELRAKISDDARLLQRALDRLVSSGRLQVDRDQVWLTDARAPQVDPLVERVAELIARAQLAPPRPAECAQQLSAPLPTVTKAIEVLLRGGRLVRVQEHYFDAHVLAALKTALIAHLRKHGSIDAQGWKTLTGQSRKFAIPLAEHFDAQRVTLRVGDLRKLR